MLTRPSGPTPDRFGLRRVVRAGHHRFRDRKGPTRMDAVHRDAVLPEHPSNHAIGTNAGAEILRRIYGEGGQSASAPTATW